MRIDSCGRWPLAALSALLLGGCVSERVVLLPAPDGRPTAITVRDSRGEVVLDQPFAGVERRGNEFKVLKSSEAEVKAKFKTFMKDLPKTDYACFKATQGGDYSGFAEVPDGFYDGVIRLRMEQAKARRG